MIAHEPQNCGRHLSWSTGFAEGSGGRFDTFLCELTDPTKKLCRMCRNQRASRVLISEASILDASDFSETQMLAAASPVSRSSAPV